MIRAFTAILLLCAVASAAPPVAKITGPTTARPGSIVILSIDGKAKHAKWKVDASLVDVPKDGAAEALEATAAVLREAGYSVQLPASDEPQIYMVLDDKQRLLLSSFVGTYRVKLVVGDDEGVDLAEHQVVVSGTIPVPVPVPVPIPIPTPTPTPVPIPVPTDFAAKLTAAVKAVPAAAVEFGKVAGVYVTVADQIKGGLLSTPQQVTGFTSVLVPVAAGSHAAEWANIEATVIKPYLATLALTKAADYEPVWRMIAASVKAGLVDIPPPVPVPVPVTGLHVLILEETGERNKLPPGQLGVLTSTVVRKWLTENKAEWRIWDKDVDAQFEAKVWQDALKLPHTSLPWIIISNGTTGYSGPLPASVDETITLLGKYK